MRTRREFLLSIAGGASTLVVSRAAYAMQEVTGAANVPMDQDAYRPVRLSPKPNARPSMSDDARDDFEHRIKCQCGCVLDVFTCRTTDFSCPVSPAMHADVVSLVNGGYNAAEILGAFQGVYGERVLMAPLKRGFNLLGYIVPFAVLAAGAAGVGVLIRRWRARAPSAQFAPVTSVDATPDELAEIDKALRDDG